MQKNTENTTYRKGLPPVPERLLKLPIRRGYPVPWFVSEVNGDYDFRIVDARKLPEAIQNRLCWICGEKLGSTLVFSIGPMCAVNRVNSEPPSHRECAEFAVKACPFLTQQQSHYRENNLPEGATDPAGIAIKRQPGAILLWITRSYAVFNAGNGILFNLGDATETLWFREGRPATRAEVLESIETGLPILRDVAKKDGRIAELQLEEKIKTAMQLVPPEKPKKLIFGSASRANRVESA